MKYLEDSTGRLIPCFTFEQMKATCEKLDSIGMLTAIELFAPNFISIDWFLNNADEEDRKALYIVDEFSATCVTFMLVLEESMENVVEM